MTGGYPSAGPYYFAKNVVNERTSLRRNPYWHGNRPRHIAGVDVRWNLNEQTAYQQTLANQLDEGPIPASEIGRPTAARFGINKTRFWRKPINCMSYIPFNNGSGIFAGNPQLRKAVNWVLDRTEYSGGSFGITPWTHLLTPLTPGAVTAKSKQPYGVHANIAKARKLAAGHFRDGKITVAYRSSGNGQPGGRPRSCERADPARFRPGEDRDEGVLRGADLRRDGRQGQRRRHGRLAWDGALTTRTIRCSPCLALHAVPGYDAKIAAAEQLPPAQRAKALGKLDIAIMKNVAPLAPMGYYNNLFFFSNRVDPRSLVYSPVYTDWSIPALSLK